MYLKEKQIKVSVKILKILHTTKDSDIRKFINDYKELCKNMDEIDYHKISEIFEKAVKKNKVHKKIRNVYYEHKNFIHTLVENNLFWLFTNIFFMYNDSLDWFLDIFEKVDKNIIEKFLNQIEQFDLEEFIFTESNMNLQSCIRIYKNFISKKEEFWTILTDGDVFLLGRFYNNDYPYYLKNAKYIFEINSDRKNAQLYINTFDIELPSKEKLESSMKNKPTFDNAKELNERTNFIRYLFELSKMQEHLTYSKINFEHCKLDNSKIYIDTIQMIESHLKEVESKISEAEDNSIHYGYNKELLQINMEYMRSCQRNMNDL